MSNAPAPVDQPTGGNTLALVSLLLGVGCFVPGIGVIAGPGAIITGIMALRRSGDYTRQGARRGMAIAGIVLGSINLLVYLLVVLALSLPPGRYQLF